MLMPMMLMVVIALMFPLAVVTMKRIFWGANYTISPITMGMVTIIRVMVIL